MTAQWTDKRMSFVAFERLEPRFLLDAAPLGESEVCDGKDEAPQPPAVEVSAEAPVVPTTDAADADGDGKLGLKDAKAGSGEEPVEQPTVEESYCMCHRNLAAEVVGLSTGPGPLVGTSQQAGDDPTVAPQEFQPVIDILNSTDGYQDSGEDPQPVLSLEQPILIDSLGSAGDFAY